MYLHDQVINLAVKFLGVVLHSHLVSPLDLAEHVLHLPRPPHLVGRQDHHALVVIHPLHSVVYVCVCIHAMRLMHHTHDIMYIILFPTTTLYSGKLSCGAKFRSFCGRSASAKIKTVKIAASAISIAPRLPVCAGAAKIKTTKISLGALRGDSAKFCTRQNFLLSCYTVYTCKPSRIFPPLGHMLSYSCIHRTTCTNLVFCSQ